MMTRDFGVTLELSPLLFRHKNYLKEFSCSKAKARQNLMSSFPSTFSSDEC